MVICVNITEAYNQTVKKLINHVPTSSAILRDSKVLARYDKDGLFYPAVVQESFQILVFYNFAIKRRILHSSSKLFQIFLTSMLISKIASKVRPYWNTVYETQSVYEITE